jgi:NitT/TauT family transport system ATP-binding protein
MSSFVEFDHVWLAYNEALKAAGHYAVEDITLNIRKGEFIAIVGPSGCGKSTFMKLTTGLKMPSKGRITIGGQPVTGPLKITGMAFQAPSLLPWRTTVNNVLLPLEIVEPYRSTFKAKRKEYEAKARALLQSVGLGGYEDKFPWQLSGGMQQRVAIARALMPKPQILLMDEPFGALDAQTREVMHDLIRHVHRLEKSTILFVTHDVDEAIYLGGRVVLMAPRPGRIDSIYEVPLPAERNQDMKLAPAFLTLKKQILARIRETSGMNTDLELLEQLTRTAPGAG